MTLRCMHAQAAELAAATAKIEELQAALAELASAVRSSKTWHVFLLAQVLPPGVCMGPVCPADAHAAEGADRGQGWQGCCPPAAPRGWPGT